MTEIKFKEVGNSNLARLFSGIFLARGIAYLFKSNSDFVIYYSIISLPILIGYSLYIFKNWFRAVRKIEIGDDEIKIIFILTTKANIIMNQNYFIKIREDSYFVYKLPHKQLVAKIEKRYLLNLENWGQLEEALKKFIKD